MKLAYRFLATPSPCGYLPDQLWRLEYAHVEAISAGEYAERMLRGWRRFGHTLFRPRCMACSACRSLRVDAAAFAPDRSQRRNRKANEGVVALRLGRPELARDALELFLRYHECQAEARGWPRREEDPWEFHESFVSNPFPTEQWRYELDGELIGLGFVDALPVGLSAIYFVHDPAHRRRGLGTWNVLCLIDEARRRGLPHVYLGYHVAGCPSLAYKARFQPYQLLGPDGLWREGDAPPAPLPAGA